MMDGQTVPRSPDGRASTGKHGEKKPRRRECRGPRAVHRGARDGGEPPPESTAPVPVARLLDLVQRDSHTAAVLHWLSGVVVDAFTDQGGPPPRWVLRRGCHATTEVVRPDVAVEVVARLEEMANEARARVDALLTADVRSVKLPPMDSDDQYVQPVPVVVRNENLHERGRRPHVQTETEDEPEEQAGRPGAVA